MNNKLLQEICFDLDHFIASYEGTAPVTIYGVTAYASHLIEKLNANNIQVRAITCSSKSRYGSEFCGLPVLAPEDIASDSYYIIATVSAKHKRDIMYDLLDRGVPAERLVIPIENPDGLYYDYRLTEYPEFAQAERELAFRRITSDKPYFCDYFTTNGIHSLSVYGDDAMVHTVTELLSGSGVSIERIDKDTDPIHGDAILVTDREQFIFLEEAFMDRCELPVIDFWTVVRKYG